MKKIIGYGFLVMMACMLIGFIVMMVKDCIAIGFAAWIAKKAVTFVTAIIMGSVIAIGFRDRKG